MSLSPISWVEDEENVWLGDGGLYRIYYNSIFGWTALYSPSKSVIANHLQGADYAKDSCRIFREDRIKQLQGELKAISGEPTPITPEALEAAGWKPKLELKSLKEFRHDRIITIRFWNHGKVDIMLEAALCPLPIPNCKTMEQLHQLLEMMGVKR